MEDIPKREINTNNNIELYTISKYLIYMIYDNLNKYDILRLSSVNKSLRNMATQYHLTKKKKSNAIIFYDTQDQLETMYTSPYICSQYEFNISISLEDFIQDFNNINYAHLKCNLMLNYNSDTQSLYNICGNFKGILELSIGFDLDTDYLNIIEQTKCIKKINTLGQYDKKLKSDSLEELVCSEYSDGFDFSECVNLKHIFLYCDGTLPSFDISHHPSLERLYVSVWSYQNINPKNIIHTSLTHITLNNKSSNIIFDISNYPNLIELEIGEFYNGTIICNNISKINKLIINNDKDYSNILHYCKYLEYVKFGGNYINSINLINLTNLKEIHIVGELMEALDATNLPQSIEYIELGQIYSHDINWKYLKNLKKVNLGGFDYVLDDSKLPSSVESIQFGSMYDNNIELIYMPKLKEIIFPNCSLFNSPINVSKCDNLKIIKFGEEFDQYITKKSIPNTIEGIILGDNFSQIIDPYDYPFIKYICYGTMIHKYVIYDIDAYKIMKDRFGYF